MIKIYTINDCSPEFVPVQLAALRKYLQEDFQYIVCNSHEGLALKPDKAKEVNEVCSNLGIPVVEIQEDVDVCVSNYNLTGGSPLLGGRYLQVGIAGNYMLQWVWSKIIVKEKGFVAFLHSDVFPVEPIKFTDYLKEHVLCSVLSRKESAKLLFLWEPLLLLDMDRLPEPDSILWWPSMVEGVWTDTGGQTHYYLQKHPEINPLEIWTAGERDDDPPRNFEPARYQYFYVGFGGPRLLHYQSGSRWCTDTALSGGLSMTREQSDEYHSRKLAWAKGIIGS